MKRIYLSFLLIISLTFITSQAWAYVLVEGWNINQTSASMTWGWPTQIAWKYTPSQTYLLGRIEFFTAATAGTRTIQLRTNVTGNVGSVLSSGSFNITPSQSWQGANIIPYTVSSGTSYWITLWYVYGDYTSTASSGTIIPLRLGYDNDSNSYTLDYNATYPPGFAPMAKFYKSDPVPEPASLSLLGLGLVGIFGLKRKKA